MENKVKQDIVEWISKPENEQLLETLLLMKENSPSADWMDDLSDSEKKSLERGREDHKSNNTLTSEEFWKKHV